KRYNADRSIFLRQQGYCQACLADITVAHLGTGDGGVPMRSNWRGSALALIAAGFCLTLGAPAQAGCVVLSGTADGFDKQTAVSRAQLALADYIKQYKAE